MFHANKTLTGVDTAVAGLNAALVTINKPKSGTLSMLDDTILQIRLTIDSLNKVALHEQNQLTTLDSDLAQLVSHTNGALTAVTGTANQATTTLSSVSHSVQDVSDHVTPAADAVTSTTVKLGAAIDALSPSEVALAKSVKDFDELVTSSPVQQILVNMADGTKTGDHILITTDALETKMAQCTLHPNFGCFVKQDLLFGAQVGGYLLK